MLLSPSFIYLVEHGAEPVTGRPAVASLSPFEVAARLSYHFWQTMPDRELFEAARTGALHTAEGYRTQVDRLFADPRTPATIDQFFQDAFKLADVPRLDQLNGDPVFKAFAGPDLPAASLHTAMADEVLALLRHHTWETPGRFADLLTSDLSFARAPELARLYGLPPWTGRAARPQHFPPAPRPGLLTRAAFLVSGTTSTRPIMKGVFVRHTLLCDEIPPPPNNAAATPPPTRPPA